MFKHGLNTIKMRSCVFVVRRQCFSGTAFAPEKKSENTIDTKSTKSNVEMKLVNPDTKITCSKPVTPIDKFTDLDLSQNLRSFVSQIYYKSPTPIQRYTLPLLFDKKNIFVSSKNFSGKSAAFNIAMANSIVLNQMKSREVGRKSPMAIIVTDDKRSCYRRYNEFVKLGTELNIQGCMLNRERFFLYYMYVFYSHFIVGELTSLVTQLRSGKFDLTQLECLIVDNANVIIDGYEDKLCYLLNNLNDKTQVSFWSETSNDLIYEKALSIHSNLIRVKAEEKILSDKKINYNIVNPNERLKTAIKLINKYKDKKLLIFFRAPGYADAMLALLEEMKLNVTTYHDKLDDEENAKNLKSFVEGKNNIMTISSKISNELNIESDHAIVYESLYDKQCYAYVTNNTNETDIIIIKEEDQIAKEMLLSIYQEEKAENVPNELLSLDE